MTFIDPVRLWLLVVIPVLVVLYVALQFRKTRYAIRFTNVALLDRIAPRRTNWRQHLAVGLALVTFAFSIVLFARPSRSERQAYDVQSHFTVVLAIDVSLSMSATDVEPTRLGAAEAAAKKFLSRLPDNFQVSLVDFAGQANLVVAPTTNRKQVERALNGLRLGARTATGEGIYTSLGVIKQAVGNAAKDASGHIPALIVMLSDGYRTAGRSQVGAAQAARRMGVPIDTVAVGTPHGVVSVEGQQIAVPVEPDELRTVSEISGGKSFTASTPADLLDAYKSVGSLLVYRTVKADATSDYVPYLVVLMLLTTGSGIFVASRWP